MKKPKYFSPSVDMAARILNYLSRYKTKNSTLTEISTSLDINKSTCLRILKTLEMHKYVYYDLERRKYSLGSNMAVLGSRAHETLDYLVYIKSYLQQAAEKIGHTAVFIEQVSENRMMFVAQHEGKEESRIVVSIGNKFPITESSYGKWALAYSTEEKREKILSQGLKKVTKNTVVDIETYRNSLDEIKNSGVLVSVEEYQLGLTAISCPLFWNKEFLGVIAIIGIASLITEEDIDGFATTLKSISEECSF